MISDRWVRIRTLTLDFLFEDASKLILTLVNIQKIFNLILNRIPHNFLKKKWLLHRGFKQPSYERIKSEQRERKNLGKGVELI